MITSERGLPAAQLAEPVLDHVRSEIPAPLQSDKKQKVVALIWELTVTGLNGVLAARLVVEDFKIAEKLIPAEKTILFKKDLVI